jgi:plasmid stabilization system protein ParE
LLKLAITQQARTDLADVQAFTIELFGLEQWPIYRQRISDSLQRLRNTPMIGKQVEGLPATYRRYHLGRPKGAHILYYKVDANKLLLLRVVHDSRDQSGVTW